LLFLTMVDRGSIQHMIDSRLIKICVRFGLVAGVLTSVLMIILFYIGKHPFLIAPFLDFRILIFGVFIFFSLKEFRDYYQEGLLYFWQALPGSLVVVLVASLAGSAGLYFFGLVEPGFLQRYIQEMMAYLKTFPPENIEQIGKETYERNLNGLPATNLADLVKTYFFQGTIIGFFISIILSVILRRTT